MQLFFNAISFPLGSEFSVEGEEYMKKISIIPLIPVVISFIIAEGILIYGDVKENSYMDVGGCIAVVVALIGVAGGIWMQIVQFKKDAQRIDSVRTVSCEVKNDTTDMRPKVTRIENVTDNIDKRIGEKILPKIDKLDGIDEVLKEIEFKKRIANEVLPSLGNPEYIVTGIQQVYKENARLNEENKNLNRNVYNLKAENEFLKLENARLNDKLNNQQTSNMDKSIDEAVSEEMLNTQDISQENDEPSMSR